MLRYTLHLLAILVPSLDLLAQPAVNFPDGHVETVRPEFGDKPEHYDPLYP